MGRSGECVEAASVLDRMHGIAENRGLESRRSCQRLQLTLW